jgi:NAD(P)-dependent dehydrogenase (short-subunit alcohol dehydrogenase family)
MKSNIWQAIPPELHQAENIRNRLAAEIIDVTNWDDQVSGFLFAIAAFGKVDYVIPCAGVGERRWLPPVVAGQAGDFVKPDLKVSEFLDIFDV